MKEATPPLPLGYWITACALLAQWVMQYISLEWRSLFFALVGSGLVLLGARKPSAVALWSGLSYFGLSALHFLFQVRHPAVWQELLALVLVPASLRLGARLSPAPQLLAANIRNTTVALAVAGVWLWVTRSSQFHHQGRTLTLAWSALAVVVFTAGLTLRDRVYRLGGFLILALAIGRVFSVDVWKLETIHRILSFLGLGLVLLALGFVYNRYSDKIQRWL
jgi:hypothetical protein